MPVQITKPSNYPLAVTKQIELLAQNIVIARKRRKETQAQWAKKLGVSQPTMARIERGDPAVAMASYVMCMWLINPNCSLADLIAPQDDHVPLERDIAKIRARHTAVAPSVPSQRGSIATAGVAQLAQVPSTADMARLAGMGSAVEMAQLAQAPSAAYMARLAGTGAAAEMARLAGVPSVTNMARKTGGATSAANVAVGLAALVAKAQGKAK